MTLVVLGYGALALAHLLCQVVLAHAERRRQRQAADRGLGETPSVSLVVPVHDEERAVLHACLRSLDAIDYPRLETIVVGDRAADRAELRDVLEEFAGDRVRVLLQPAGHDRRLSRRAVLEEARGDLVVTIGSDTTLSRDGIRTLVGHFADPAVGAVTGGGAFTAYRRSALSAVPDPTQAGPGPDRASAHDRHLLRSVLRDGHNVVFDAEAVSRTEPPTSLRAYVRLQARRDAGSARELLWRLRHVTRSHPALLAGLLTEVALRVLLAVALVGTAWQAVRGADVLAPVLVLLGVGVLRAAYRNRDASLLLRLGYGVALGATRFWSLLTARHEGTGSAAA